MSGPHPADTYFTWAHNIEGCLPNGSFVVHRIRTAKELDEEEGDEWYASFINGDYMGRLEGPPDGMVAVDSALAWRLIPSCCKPY